MVKVKCVECGKRFNPELEEFTKSVQLVEIIKNGFVQGTKEKEVWLCSNCVFEGM